MYNKYIKRLLDICLSGLAIILLFPLFIVISILIVFFLGKPILFKQVRTGKGKKNFLIMKFRTMTNDKDNDGNYLLDSLRLTKFGSFLRSTSLDELPELINIFCGNMAIIGPRPLPPIYNEYYSAEENKRFNVRSGLIPPDSINNKIVISWDEQLIYESNYAENISFLCDLKIFINVFKILFMRNKENYGEYIRKPLNEERKLKNGVKLDDI